MITDKTSPSNQSITMYVREGREGGKEEQKEEEERPQRFHQTLTSLW
jgi:hypothetical protein